MEKVLIGLLGVVLGAILTVARELWSDHRTKRERAEYLAIRVVCMLERFMDGCVSVAGDDGEMHGRDPEGVAHISTTLPEIDFDSLDVDWRSLPFDLMYEILNFPVLVEESNGIINSVFEHVAFPPDYEEGIDERRLQYSKLGIMASGISTKLREKYKMPAKSYERWSPVDYLKETKEKVEKQISDREARNSELFKNA